jgi:hypothetical protein
MTEGLEKITAPESRALTRRQLMQRMGLSGGGLLALGSSGLLQSGTALAAVAQPTNGTISVALDLNGVLNDVRSFEGGYAHADLATRAIGTDLTDTFVSNVGYDDIVIKVGLDVAPSLAAWITESLANPNAMRSGAFSFSDSLRGEWKRLEFSNALITEIALPDCDASVAQPPLMTMRLTPEATRWTGGSGQPLSLLSKALKLNGNFRLDIGPLGGATRFVSKIQGIGIKRKLAPDQVGNAGPPIRRVGSAEITHIMLWLPENRAAVFYSWFDAFVVKRTATGELTGLLEWLSPDMTKVVASVQLQNLGIVRYAPEPIVAGTNTEPQVMVELYSERLSLSIAA